MMISIREAKRKDIDELIRIWKTLGFFYAAWDTREGLWRKLKYQPDLFLVAEVDGKVKGGVIGTYDGWGAYVNHLAIDPWFARSSAAQKLLAAIEDRLKRRGANKVFAFTFPNHAEEDVFRQAGYRQWGLSQGYEKSV